MSDYTIDRGAPSAKAVIAAPDETLSRSDMATGRRAMRRKRMTAILFLVPLLVFLSFAFVAPIGTMLGRSVHTPVVSNLVPETVAALDDWDGTGLPDTAAQLALALDLGRLQADRTAGILGEEVNRRVPGSSSVIRSSARMLASTDEADLRADPAGVLQAANPKWGETDIWLGIRSAGQRYTLDFYLRALDLERSPDGGIRSREVQIYVPLFARTFGIALSVTLLTIALGYPLSFFLATRPLRQANWLMILVLLPFWTSLLVRTTAWFALLETEGVLNSLFTWAGLPGAPFDMIRNRFAVVLSMTHILLPFMVLPLYAVMRGIDPSYMRAAQSLGGRPIPAFFRVYFPLTLPGLSAGAMLVFIIAVGYYITPAILGGADGTMITQIIAQMMQQSSWNLAAALASLLLALILVIYWLFDRFVGASNLKLG